MCETGEGRKTCYFFLDLSRHTHTHKHALPERKEELRDRQTRKTKWKGPKETQVRGEATNNFHHLPPAVGERPGCN